MMPGFKATHEDVRLYFETNSSFAPVFAGDDLYGVKPPSAIQLKALGY